MLKELIAKLFADYTVKKEEKWIQNPIEAQKKVFQEIIAAVSNTSFGKDHNLSRVKNYQDFIQHVPVQDYDSFMPYIERARKGEKDVFWPGLPKYWAKTSGSTAGAKYIPISKESIPYHIEAARNALLHYIKNKGNTQFITGKMIFLQGNPELEKENGIPVGRLSGISAHYVPNYLQKNRMPSWETNTIENWEEKVDKIVEETISENMTLISGIPPWMIMYFERLKSKSGKTIQQLFPHLQLIVTGGVNYEPYRQIMRAHLGDHVDVIQTYPASEGFIAYQDQLESEDLLLLLGKDIFYEFIPTSNFYDEAPPRLTIEQVEMGVNYALLLTTKAGLMAYSIGDTITFTSLKPYRIRVTGRIKHYTSAFGEHVISQEVETALSKTIEQFNNVRVKEFHVAPQVNPPSGKPYHEWFIEFEEPPQEIEEFSQQLDQEMRVQNPYYEDLIAGNILKPLQITEIKPHGFNAYLKSVGKLGGQFKPPRLANDREVAEPLSQFKK